MGGKKKVIKAIKRKHSGIGDGISNKREVNNISTLNDDCLLKIFTLLPIATQFRAASGMSALLYFIFFSFFSPLQSSL